MASTILNAISFLKSSLSPADYNRAKQALTLAESSLKSEKERLSRKLDDSTKDNNILIKQMEQHKRDHGELILDHSETRRQLDESINECGSLRARLAAADQEVSKLAELLNELKMLKKQNNHLSDENAGLEERRRKVEEESDCLKSRIRKLEEKNKEMDDKIKEMDNDREENFELKKENDKLKREISCLEAVADSRYRHLQRRVLELERDVAMLSGSDSDDSQDSTEPMQEHETFVLEENCEGHAGAQSCHETIHMEEKMASSMRATSATRVHGQPESFKLEAPEVEVKSASKFIVDLGSSDDDGEPTLSKGLKRKLPSSKVPLGIQTHMESSKTSTAALKPCEQKVRMSFDGNGRSLIHGESGNLKRKWDYEADLLDDLQNNTELCMKGLCALYSQEMLQLYYLRATKLAKFLTDGNAQGGLKKTLEELKDFDLKGADDCKRVAVAHSKQLFDIYKNEKDPFFAPDLVSCQKTVLATTLAKFLTGGNAEGRLTKSLADLEKFYSKGEDCKKITSIHSRQLFDLYNNGKDPFVIFC